MIKLSRILASALALIAVPAVSFAAKPADVKLPKELSYQKVILVSTACAISDIGLSIGSCLGSFEGSLNGGSVA